MHGGGSDLNTSSLRSGDKESPAWVLPKATKGSQNLTLNTGVCMLGRF